MKARSKRITLIHNPTAGWGELSQTQFMSALERGGYEIRTANPNTGLGKRLAKQTDVVVSAGGDGTVLAVARRLVHTGVPLVVLPFGTANNIAKTLGMEPTIECALATLADPQERSLDIGIASGSWGERSFVESSGVGWFCDALVEAVGEGDKGIETALQVLGDYLETYVPKKWKVKLDGVDASGEYLMIEVMNAKSFGPRIRIAPREDQFECELDVVMATAKDKAKILTYLDAMKQGHDVQAPKLTIRRAKHVELELEGKHLRMDDAVRPKQGSELSHFADLRVLPGAVRLWVAPKTNTKS